LSKKDYLSTLIKKSFSLLVKKFLEQVSPLEREQAVIFSLEKNDSPLKGINQ